MDACIGLFDSGFGGLTVMKELIEYLPNESLIYLGDTANLPYGNKAPETVIRYARANAAFLMSLKIKLLVIPCHTASCHALEILQKELPIPVVGMIEPGLKLIEELFPRKKEILRSGSGRQVPCRNLSGVALEVGPPPLRGAPWTETLAELPVAHCSHVAILGTTSTIESGLYQRQLAKSSPHIKIFAQACPLFVPFVEEGFHEHESARLIAEQYLGGLRGKIDAALLACTHYPLLRKVLKEALGSEIALIEPAIGAAKIVKEILVKKNQLRTDQKAPQYQFFASDHPEKFRKFGKLFLGQSIEKVEKK